MGLRGACWLGLALIAATHARDQHVFCEPSQWQAGYTRTRDNSAGIGNVTHDYIRQLLGSEEHSVGNIGGHQLSYSVNFFMNGSTGYTALTFQGGYKKCFKVPQMNPYDWIIHCYDHHDLAGATEYNSRPIKVGVNYEPLNNGTGSRPHVMVVRGGAEALPVQWHIYTSSEPTHKHYNTSRVPDVALYHDAKPSAKESLFAIPESCKKMEVEEGPAAEAIVREVHHSLIGRESNLPAAIHTHLGAALKEHGLPTSAPSPFTKPSQSTDSFCLPAKWNAMFFGNNDMFTLSGNVTHDYSKREFGVKEYVSNAIELLEITFIQKGSLAWSIVQKDDGPIVCKHAPVMEEYDMPCRQSENSPINVNGRPAKELHWNSTSPSGAVTYTALYQSADGLPLGSLNYTQGGTGACTNGCPFSIGFFNPQPHARQDLLTVPSSCPSEPLEEHSEEVNRMARRYASHGINNLL